MRREILCCSMHFYTISVGMLGLIGSFAPVARCAADIILDVSTITHNETEQQKKRDDLIRHSAWMAWFVIYGFSSALLIIAVHHASRVKMIPWLTCSALFDAFLTKNAFQTIMAQPQEASVLCIPVLYTLVWLGIVCHYRRLKSERVYNAVVSDGNAHNYEDLRGYASYAMWALPARPNMVLIEGEGIIRPAAV